MWYWSPKRKKIRKEKLICEHCGVTGVKLDIDHVQEVGSVPVEWQGWDAYLYRMFEGELQALCKECHRIKTNEERKGRSAAKGNTKRTKKNKDQ